MYVVLDKEDKNMSMEINSNMSFPIAPNIGGQAIKRAPLTEEQKNTLNEILAQYDSEDLSEEDAQTIVEAFKEAGIQPGEELKSLLEDAGFDAEELANLAGIQPGEQSRPPPPPEYQNNNNSVNQESLQQLQSILGQFSDLSNLNSGDEEKLNSLLFDTGLLEPGALIDTKT